MREGLIKRAIAVEKRTGHVLIATADDCGAPHLAVAQNIRSVGQNKVAINAWFCQSSVTNLAENPHISLVIWDFQ